MPTPTDRRPFYHRFAWAYDQLIPCPTGPSPDVVIRLFRDRGIAARSHVLDAGCGTGAYAIALATAGLSVVAIDRSPELLDVALPKAAAAGVAVEFVEADLLRWNPGRPIDGVLCRGVLNDLITDDDRDQAFGAFARWLRPGGVLIADVRDWETSKRRYQEQPVAEMQLDVRRASLAFRSVTTLVDTTQLLVVEERFTGTIDDQQIDDPSLFLMRCWSTQELAERARVGGFTSLAVVDDEGDGRRADRLVAVAVR